MNLRRSALAVLAILWITFLICALFFLGLFKPARHCSVRVLPAPEGPNSTATPSPAVHETSRVKPGSRFVISIENR